MRDCTSFNFRLWKRGAVIHHKWTVKPRVSISRHCLVHVYIALIDKDLLETWQASPDISEVDENYLAFRSHLSDGFVHIDSHLSRAPLAEQHPISVEQSKIENSPVLV